MQQSNGTPITRSGGYFIRTGWRAKGYSVDQEQESFYQRTKILLGIVALLLGIGAALGITHFFETVFVPLLQERLPMLAYYPSFWRLMIYFGVLFGGIAVYGQAVVMVGRSIVKGKHPLDEGYGFSEQRRRASRHRRRSLILRLVLLAVLVFVPLWEDHSKRDFLILVFGYQFLEGLYFRYISPGKSRARKRGETGSDKATPAAAPEHSPKEKPEDASAEEAPEQTPEQTPENAPEKTSEIASKNTPGKDD